MATSAHTSATAYFRRMKQEGRWNHHRAQQPGPSTVNQVTAQGEALWSTWFTSPEAEDLDGDITSATLWYCGNPAGEAREFFRLLERGVSDVEKLRSDIGISEAEMADLNEWVEWRPNLKSRIERIVDYRQRTLAEFDRLVAESAALSTPETARQPISNSL